MPHDITTECLSIRETRRQFEVVRDPVEHSLNDENLLIEKIRTILKTKCEDAWDQLNRLDDIRQKLEIDLQDKTEALRIDIDQIELTERSTGLSHKPDPMKVRHYFIAKQSFSKQCHSKLLYYRTSKALLKPIKLYKTLL